MKGLPPPTPNPFDALKDYPKPKTEDDRERLRVAIMQAVSAETYADTRKLIIEGILAYNQDASIDEDWLAAVLGVFKDEPEP